MNDIPVTILIPSYQAESFISETLSQARRQTHKNLRILVSVDQSDDRTADICRDHEQLDKRVKVFEHQQRLGWAKNVNFLISQVRSDYFSIYFHDDFIDAQYTEILLAKLLAAPDASAAQCDVLNVLPDGRQHISADVAPNGDQIFRLLTVLLNLKKGSPIRGLIRRSIAGDLRFPESSVLSFYSWFPFYLQLYSAGPVLRVPKVLYWRPSNRRDGLIEQIRRASLKNIVDDQKVNTAAAFDILDRVNSSDNQRRLIEHALFLNIMRPIRRYEYTYRHLPPTPAHVVSPRLAYGSLEESLEACPKKLRPSLQMQFADYHALEILFLAVNKDFSGVLSGITSFGLKGLANIPRLLINKVSTQMESPNLPVPRPLQDRLARSTSP